MTDQIPKKYTCHLCSNEYTRESSLKDHLLCHDGSKHFACSQCPKRFRRRQDRNKHQKSHDNSHPFSCQYCQRKFTQKGSLRYHQQKACRNLPASSTPNSENTAASEDSETSDAVRNQSVPNVDVSASTWFQPGTSNFEHGNSSMAVQTTTPESATSLLSAALFPVNPHETPRNIMDPPYNDTLNILIPDPNENETLGAIQTASLFNALISRGRYSQSWYEKVWFKAAEDDKAGILSLLITIIGIHIETSDREGRTALHVASGRGCIESVEQLLKAGAHPNTIDHDHQSPLHAAIVGFYSSPRGIEAHNTVMKTLIDYGANVDMESPISRGSEILITPIRRIVVSLLLAPKPTILSWMVPKSRKLNTPSYNGRYLLHDAILQCTPDEAKLFIDNGADVNVKCKGWNALHLACRHAKVDHVRVLLHCNHRIELADQKGRTGMHHLLKDVHEDDFIYEEDFCDLKIRAHHICAMLSSAGTDINATDKHGETALAKNAEKAGMILESMKGRIGSLMCEVLVQHGADPNLMNRHGDTVLVFVLGRVDNAVGELFNNADWDFLTPLEHHVKVLGLLSRVSAKRRCNLPSERLEEIQYEEYESEEGSTDESD